jgi:DHA1 family quinolone resistance protein-like MFS transporter
VGSLNYLTSKNPEKATATGLLNSSIGISAFLGPILGGVFMSFVMDYRSLMLFSGIVALLGVIVFKIGDRN